MKLRYYQAYISENILCDWSLATVSPVKYVICDQKG